MQALLISGSRNAKGQTAQAADALAAGLERSGALTERIFLPHHAVERCRQCDDDGWGVCRREGRCIIEDDFAGHVESLRRADWVVFATPVYFSDLSESMKAFTDRLRRVCMHDSMRSVVKGKRAIGLCVAGGGGGGAPECCVRLERVLATCGFDIVDMIPVRRQNLADKLDVLDKTGLSLANS